MRRAAPHGGALLAVLVFGVVPCSEARRFEDLGIVSATGVRQHFEVELADTASERSRGLMRRRELAPRAGMLFDFERVDRVAMWMRNTPLALDMLFIDGAGRIRSIVEQARPLSTDLIWSEGPVRAVLELNAGAARAFGLQPGDRVLHPLFD